MTSAMLDLFIFIYIQKYLAISESSFTTSIRYILIYKHGHYLYQNPFAVVCKFFRNLVLLKSVLSLVNLLSLVRLAFAIDAS